MNPRKIIDEKIVVIARLKKRIRIHRGLIRLNRQNVEGQWGTSISVTLPFAMRVLS